MKNILVIGLALLLTGCGYRIPLCDDEVVLNTTQKIIYDYSRLATEEAVALGISLMAGRVVDRNNMSGMPYLTATDVSLSAIRNGKVVPEERLRYCRAILSLTYPDLNKEKNDWRNKIVKKMIDVQQEQGGIVDDDFRNELMRTADIIASMAFMRIMHLSGNTEYQIAYSIQNTTTPYEFVVTVEPFLEILYEQ